MDLADLTDRLRRFAAERDWDQFHSPKNLAMALSGEAGELLELFQWLTQEESRALAGSPEDMAKVREELADTLGVDLEAAALDKIEINAERYPVDKARGTATKYSEL